MKPNFSSPPKHPFATVIAYGPDNKTATKLVVSIFKKPGQRDADELHRWIVQGGDIRQDPTIAAEVTEFIKRHHATQTATYDRLLGCPHEEGKDYPMGETCPHCPFWANVDRFTHEPKSPDLPLTAEQILAGLRIEQQEQPLVSLAAAERHREILIEPLLQALERGIADPKGTPPGEAVLFSYAMCLLAKWREPRAYPLVIRWLSLPGEGAFDIGGDTVTEWGSRVLASVCDRDIGPIKALILNREANEYGRGQAIEALAVLAAWGELPMEKVVDYFLWLAREVLERKSGGIWNGLAVACYDIEAIPVFPELRRACAEGLIERLHVGQEEFDELEAAPRGKTLADFRKWNPPITDVAKETAWWSCFSRSKRSEVMRPLPGGGEALEEDAIPEPYVAPPKIGRNDPCPCGSGKKYKKCCGRQTV